MPPDSFDHGEIRDLVQSIGVMLGFDADAEVKVAHGARVDVVWRARIGNLGMVTCVFEVHKSGSIDGLLLNLQKAKSSPTVQKVIAVSDEQQLERIKHEFLIVYPVVERSTTLVVSAHTVAEVLAGWHRRAGAGD